MTLSEKDQESVDAIRRMTGNNPFPAPESELDHQTREVYAAHQTPITKVYKNGELVVGLANMPYWELDAKGNLVLTSLEQEVCVVKSGMWEYFVIVRE